MKKATKTTQLRLTTVITKKQKREVTRMARDLTNNNIGELLRQVLAERYKRYIKRAKQLAVKRSATRAAKSKKLVRGVHVTPSKPARKHSTRNSTTNGSRSSSAKSALKSRSVRVSSKKPGRSTRSSSKKSGPGHRMTKTL